MIRRLERVRDGRPWFLTGPARVRTSQHPDAGQSVRSSMGARSGATIREQLGGECATRFSLVN
jgi:hypothetical protein